MIPVSGGTWSSIGAAVGNHLWQSTLFALLAWLLARILKKNGPGIRYCVWLAASLKFLIPFAMAGVLAGYVRWPASPMMKANLPVLRILNQPLSEAGPFSPNRAATVTPVSRPSSLLPLLLLTVWLAGVVAVILHQYARRRRLRALLGVARVLKDGREADILRRVQSRRRNPPRLILASSASMIEPGVHGVMNPVLLLPAGVSDRLDDAQLESIVAHEVFHVERRDNLAAVIHLIVETIFWFHPLVWWIGARLVEERERACDEHVLKSGGEPRIYAGAILKVCEYYMASPLTYAAGVTGSNLKNRIEDIMMYRIGAKLNAGRKLLLASAAVVAVTPVLAGLINAGQAGVPPQNDSLLAFEVVSIKVNNSGDPRNTGWLYLPGGKFSAKGVPIPMLILEAYNTTRLIPGPELEKTARDIERDRYDIEAVAPAGTIPPDMPSKIRNEKMRLMLRTLLADRFKLTVNRQMKEGPVYAIVIGKNGPKLQKAALQEKDCMEQATNVNDVTSCHAFGGGQGQGLHGQAVDMSDLAAALSRFSDRPVLDKTGLGGLYNIQTAGWVPLRQRPPRPAGQEPTAEDLAFADPLRPTIYAILDELGLKLESQNAVLESIVVEHVERPQEN